MSGPRSILEGEVIRTTDLAILIDTGSEEVWVPRSVCEDGEEISEGDSDPNVEDWWLSQKGLQ